MSIHQSVTGLLSASVLVIGIPAASGQDYPSRPIRIIASLVGGGADAMARLTAQGLSAGLGQSVIVENRGTGVIPGELTVKATPDGYTLLVYNNGVWTAQFFEKTPYDAAKDLAPVSWISKSPQVLVVHASVPVSSVTELIALAKAKPGTLNITSAPVGTISHINVELLKALGGVDIVRVPYSSNSNETADLLSGQVHLSFTGPGSASSLLKSGKLKALAVTSAQPSVLLPGVPAMASSLPGFVTQTSYGIWAPAKTPQVVIKRVNQEAVRYFNSTAVKEKLLSQGSESVGSSAEEFAALIRADMANLAKLSKEGRLK